MKRAIVCILAICLLFTGCSWMDGSYLSVTPHRQPSSDSQSSVVVAENYLQLRRALEDMISSGTESCVISVGGFQEDQLVNSMEIAVRYLRATYPIGAYSVDTIQYELGTSGGVAAVAVEVSYRHSQAEIQKIREVSTMDEAKGHIRAALGNYDTSLVMMVDRYESMDLQQLAEDYTAQFPGAVMETPVITEQTYPNAGTKRVLELKFTYQSSRDSLRSMQEQVQRVFASAALYVSHDAQDSQKFSQLYSFLMERFSDYQIKTSITPAYSLLIHGVGDSKAFATVFSQMCRDAGLTCMSVVGTRGGEPWFWNIVQVDGYYYHVDLLDCQAWGNFRTSTDDQMHNYVWDYSAYPACTGHPEAAIGEDPLPDAPITEETVPSTPIEESQAPSEETTPSPTEPTVTDPT